MVQRLTRERELYERCPSCVDGAPMDTCERCGGVGFVLTGLTMGMLSQFVHQVEGLARMGGSIHRLARRVPR
jgi:NAD(P)H-hydrate repair Nnr-like enzyme with NAD(P)H-hydrate dehydratase domain